MTVRTQYQPEGSTSLELANHVEAAIGDGTIEAGFRLPPIRDLAAAQKVAPATVAAAYKRLRERGLVVTRGRQGTIVARAPRFHIAMSTAVPEGKVNLRNGNPSPEFLHDPADFASPPPVPGLPSRTIDRNDPALLELTAARFDRDGIPSSHLAVVGGAQDGLERILLGHASKGDLVAIEDPTYPPLADLLIAMGLTPVPVELDAEGMLPESLAAALGRGVTAVVITPRAQNPTGAALSRGRAAELLAVMRDRPELLVVEDDHMADVGGAESVSVAADPQVQSWAVVRSVSKSLGPDLRLAVASGDAGTIARMESRQALGTGWVSTILQRMVAGMWTSPEVTKSTADAEAAYTERRSLLIAELAARGIAASGPSGLNVWVPVEREAPVVEGLLAAGWSVSPGELFRLESEPGIRVTISCLDPADAPRFADDLAKVLSATWSGRAY
ncbi:MAG TPA: aminotransferase class I/II-fold pyridoxal phosphate-dependent enzyme [Solirubrobacterales bacterium]|nr:aminotransferase class I/II-fold pyridoxal phosphate-dependent enzyme [Solirubrobacterales bacterium]